MTAPGPRVSGGNRICRRAIKSKRPTRASVPTFATSPSSSAFVACVVECAMNAIRPALTPGVSSARRIPATIPAATPSGASWVVGTLMRATTSPLVASTATTSVNVPPTSIPTRNAPFTGSAHPVRRDALRRRAARERGPHWLRRRSGAEPGTCAHSRRARIAAFGRSRIPTKTCRRLSR